MFIHMSAILSIGEVSDGHPPPGRHPTWADIPPWADTYPGQTPTLDRQPPWADSMHHTGMHSCFIVVSEIYFYFFN